MIAKLSRFIRTPDSLGSFFFVKQHKNIRQKHKKMIKAVDKGFNEVYNIIIKQTGERKWNYL